MSSIGRCKSPRSSPKKKTKNEQLIINVQRELFSKGNFSAVERYSTPNAIEHNPTFPDGPSGFHKGMVERPNVSYEMGLMVAKGNLVMVHGRYTGIGPKPMIAVDIFRISRGKIAEHWDVIQEEVTDTVSGHPMFDPKEATKASRMK